MKLFLPIILIAVGVGGYFLITQPILDEIKVLQVEADSYDEALGNSKMLQEERDRLTSKFNSFRQDDMDRLNKMVPDSVDNIQLILEIQEEAANRGIVVQNVEFEPEIDEDELAEGEEPVERSSSRAPSGLDNSDFESFELEFSVEGSYDNFVNFMSLIERSLRLVDINQISFTPGTSEGKDEAYNDFYKYLFRINTYRLID